MGHLLKTVPVHVAGEDLSSDNYVEYRAKADGEWKPSGILRGTCVKMLLKSQWKTYTDGLAKSTCKAEQRRMLDKGPPINISDKSALPCPDGTERRVMARCIPCGICPTDWSTQPSSKDLSREKIGTDIGTSKRPSTLSMKLMKTWRQSGATG